MYVTFQFRPTKFVAEAMGAKAKKYGILCNTMDEVHETMADINSFDGVSYIRLNKCGKLPKGTKIVKITDRL